MARAGGIEPPNGGMPSECNRRQRATVNNYGDSSGGYQYILPHGSAYNGTVYSGAIQNDDGYADGVELYGFQAVFSVALAHSNVIYLLRAKGRLMYRNKEKDRRKISLPAAIR